MYIVQANTGNYFNKSGLDANTITNSNITFV